MKVIYKIIVMVLLILTSSILPTNITAEQLTVEQIKDGVKKGTITDFTYELFGAKGDGITNDFNSIKSAHDCANDLYLEGYPITVKATKGKTYYITFITLLKLSDI